MMEKTVQQFTEVLNICGSLFEKKLTDYGAAWRVLRPSSVTDEGFIAIVNYAIIGLIQLNKGVATGLDNDSREDILQMYHNFAIKARDLMEKKNHDYGEAWREMRVTSITDLIYQKVLRTKQIEDNKGKTIVSEGLAANYYDMLNYAVFCLVKIKN